MPKLLSHEHRVPPSHHNNNESVTTTTTPRIVATSKPTKTKEDATIELKKPLWKQVATIPRNRAMSNNLQKPHKIDSVTKKSNVNQIKQQKAKYNEGIKKQSNEAPDSNMNRKTNRVINKDLKPYFKLTYLTTP